MPRKKTLKLQDETISSTTTNNSNSNSHHNDNNMKDRKESATTDNTNPKTMDALYSHYHKEEEIVMDPESVYEFYTKQLLPAIISSFPILMQRLASDSGSYLKISFGKFIDFLLPAWYKETEAVESWSLAELWQQHTGDTQASIAEFMLSHFDTNGDGQISPNELLNMTEIMSRLPPPPTQSFWTWFSREWPLMDWKIGLFLWRSFGGMLLLLAMLSIVPGRLHRTSGKILRWPILLLTKFLIIVELMVYIVIRLVIRAAELIVAKPKHRALRRKMATADSYETWYQYAAALDLSQKRDKWQRTVNDSTSYRYNWALIRQLMEDMRYARDHNDSLLALAVLQQCTRKNVGGVMSEDLFSFTNTGEPKLIVKEFIEEVTKTLQWITDEAMRIPECKTGTESEAKVHYSKRLERKVRNEKDKLWKSLLTWATLSFGEDAEQKQRSSIKTIEGANKLTSQNNKNNKHVDVATPPKKVRARVGSTGELSAGTTNSDGSGPLALPNFHREQLITFLKRARAAYGRTALCLSGGGMMGLYHFGHLEGLMETDCLPHIISGTSAGSVLGAIVCTRTNEELSRDLRPEVVGPRMKCFERPWLERFKSLWQHGTVFCADDWLKMIKWFTCGDMTFEEAYKKTGRTYCITLASTTKKAPPVLMNHITAPNVTIASAVVASAAVPGLIKPVRLQVKASDGTIQFAGEETYFDGSIETDIPVNGLAEQFNCQFFIAAQCNPHVVPFFFDAKGGVGRPSRWGGIEQEASWRGGFLLAALEMYLKNDMKAKFKFLNDLEAAIGFTSTMMVQSFEGSITIVPQVKLADFFTLFTDPDVKGLETKFRVGAVAAYQHAAMIRLHYRIADTIDECLDKLGGNDKQRKDKAKPSRRASFETSHHISQAVASLQPPAVGRMPSIITAALKERLEDSDSTSMSDSSMI